MPEAKEYLELWKVEVSTDLEFLEYVCVRDPARLTPDDLRLTILAIDGYHWEILIPWQHIRRFAARAFTPEELTRFNTSTEEENHATDEEGP